MCHRGCYIIHLPTPRVVVCVLGTDARLPSAASSLKEPEEGFMGCPSHGAGGRLKGKEETTRLTSGKKRENQ